MAGVARGEPLAGIELLELLDREILDGPVAIGLAVDRGVMKKNVLAVFRQTHVDLGPLETVFGDAGQRRAGILRRLAAHATVDHHLKRPRRPHRLVKIDGRRRRGK